MFLRALAILACVVSLNACGAGGEQTDSSKRQLMVTGTAAGMERFVARQSSRRPALTVSRPQIGGNGQATAVVDLPSAFTGQDVVHITREALAEGLAYRYVEHSVVSRRT